MDIIFDSYVDIWDVMKREQIFEEVSSAGYDGLNIYMNDGFFYKRDQSDVISLSGLAEKYKLKIPTVVLSPFITAFPGKEREVMEITEFALHITRQLKSGRILVWAATPETPRNQALSTLSLNLKEIVKMADRDGIAVDLEFSKGGILDNYRDTIEFLQADSIRGVRLCMDSYHIWNDGIVPCKAISDVRDFLGTVHFSASDRGEPGNPDDKFDYMSFVKGLREVNYEGDVSVQYHLRGDISSIKRSYNFIKKLLF